MVFDVEIAINLITSVSRWKGLALLWHILLSLVIFRIEQNRYAVVISG